MKYFGGQQPKPRDVVRLRRSGKLAVVRELGKSKLHLDLHPRLPVKFPPPVSRACPKCGFWQRPCACTNFS